MPAASLFHPNLISNWQCPHSRQYSVHCTSTLQINAPVTNWLMFWEAWISACLAREAWITRDARTTRDAWISTCFGTESTSNTILKRDTAGSILPVTNEVCPCMTVCSVSLLIIIMCWPYPDWQCKHTLLKPMNPGYMMNKLWNIYNVQCTTIIVFQNHMHTKHILWRLTGLIIDF